MASLSTGQRDASFSLLVAFAKGGLAGLGTGLEGSKGIPSPPVVIPEHRWNDPPKKPRAPLHYLTHLFSTPIAVPT